MIFPRFCLRAAMLTVTSILLTGGQAMAEDNIRLCESDFWSATPTVADVQAEIDKGARLDGVCLNG